MATHSVFLPEKSQGQKSLAGYSSRDGHNLVTKQQQRKGPVSVRFLNYGFVLKLNIRKVNHDTILSEKIS